MKITASNLLQHELIGLKVEVEESTNKYMVGLSGRVVEETRNMLFIEDKEGRGKKVEKASCVFIFGLDEGIKARVNGTMLVSRPEDRIKAKAMWKR